MPNDELTVVEYDVPSLDSSSAISSSRLVLFDLRKKNESKVGLISGVGGLPFL